MHLALGQGDLTSLKAGDYAACERQARRALGTFIAAGPGHNRPADPYPEPVEHCVICRWDDLCKDRSAATTTCCSSPGSPRASRGRA